MIFIFWDRKDNEYVKKVSISLLHTYFSTKCSLFQPHKLKTEGQNDDFSGGPREDNKWAGLLAMGSMSFKRGEKIPGVGSIAMILVRTTILTY